MSAGQVTDPVDMAFETYEKILRDLRDFDGDRRGIASVLLRQRDIIADLVLARGPGFARWEDQ